MYKIILDIDSDGDFYYEAPDSFLTAYDDRGGRKPTSTVKIIKKLAFLQKMCYNKHKRTPPARRSGYALTVCSAAVANLYQLKTGKVLVWLRKQRNGTILRIFGH